MPVVSRRAPLLLAPLAAGFLSCAPLEGPATSAEAIFGGVDDTTHTSVIWKIGHMGFSFPHGIFSNIEGTLTL